MAISETTKSLVITLPRRLCFRCCLFVCVFFCLLATLRKNFQIDLREIFSEGWQWANEQMIKFRWQSISPSGYRDCFPDTLQKVINGHSFILIRQMAALVRRALVKVCTVPVLLVNYYIHICTIYF